MTTVSLEGTQELMKHRDVAVILATGGMGLVRAAYSAGKPAYGVGPGNAPCYIEQSADLAKAASDIVLGKSFDNGVLCSSPNSVVVDRSVADEVKRQFIQQGSYFLTPAEADRLAGALVTPSGFPIRSSSEDGEVHCGADRRHGAVRHTRPGGRAQGRWPGLSPFHREALSGPFLLRRGRLAGGV
jgi:acyl-CoA reductase-like NAD-dependent aldehyde dehydrogenase